METPIIIAIIGGLLGGSAVAALVNQIGEGVREYKRRKYANEDENTKDMREVKGALMWVMYDRIRHLGLAYVAQGEIDFDDRRIFAEMHKCYQALGGNGDLNTLTQEVNKLPLKS